MISARTRVRPLFSITPGPAIIYIVIDILSLIAREIFGVIITLQILLVMYWCGDFITKRDPQPFVLYSLE